MEKEDVLLGVHFEVILCVEKVPVSTQGYSMVKGERTLSLSSNTFGIPKTVEHVTWQGEIDWTLPAAKNDSW